MGAITWTPLVSETLSTRVVARFVGAFQNVRASDLLAICGTGDGGGTRNVVALIVGKDLSLTLREKGEDKINWREPAIYAHGATMANYVQGITLSRLDALDDQIGKLMAISETAGGIAAEQPSRMIEALVPLALETESYDNVPYYGDHPQKVGSSTVVSNWADLGDLDIASYDEAVTLFSQMKDEDGRACNSKPSVLMYGSDYREIARDILTNRVPLNSAGGENMRTGDGVRGIEVADWPKTFWGLCDLRGTDRPFWYNELKGFTVTPWITDPNSADAIVHNGLRWIVDAWVAMLLGNWRKSFLVIAPGDKAAVIAESKAKLKMNKFLTNVN